ncbi:hypothetical protein HMPREF9996_02200 [Aggregatibacter actinomycetemcomitans Y4]|nr:hypothetical protein HMPREF9996_02200 [Aggregatibacter actinomycetemcomitans Y4]
MRKKCGCFAECFLRRHFYSPNTCLISCSFLSPILFVADKPSPMIATEYLHQ